MRGCALSCAQLRSVALIGEVEFVYVQRDADAGAVTASEKAAAAQVRARRERRKRARDGAQRDASELAGDATLGSGFHLRRLVGERKIEHRDAGWREPPVIARLQARVER